MIKKYVLEFFLDKINLLTPNSNKNNNKTFYKKAKSLKSTQNYFNQTKNLSSIEIRRATSQTSRLVDYAAGSVLTENDLDTDSNQGFYMSQEAIDDANDRIKLDNADFHWDAQSKRIKNIADPVDNTDVVN